MKTLLLAVSLWGCDTPKETTPNDTSDTADTTDTGETSDGGDGGDGGLTGLDAYCAHYKECGGTYYETAEDCVEASLTYWGDCPEMRDALDAFGDCMIGLSCDDYNPDVYNPADSECAGEWQGLYDAEC